MAKITTLKVPRAGEVAEQLEFSHVAGWNAKWYRCPEQHGPVGFPVRAHAWIVGQVPSWGCVRDI